MNRTATIALLLCSTSASTFVQRAVNQKLAQEDESLEVAQVTIDTGDLGDEVEGLGDGLEGLGDEGSQSRGYYRTSRVAPTYDNDCGCNKPDYRGYTQQKEYRGPAPKSIPGYRGQAQKAEPAQYRGYEPEYTDFNFGGPSYDGEEYCNESCYDDLCPEQCNACEDIIPLYTSIEDVINDSAREAQLYGQDGQATVSWEHSGAQSQQGAHSDVYPDVYKKVNGVENNAFKSDRKEREDWSGT